jgi:hypothetical protein
MMSGLDDLLVQALHDFALDAPDLPPLSPRSRRRILFGRLRALLAGAVAVAGVCAGLALGAIAVTHASRSPGPAVGPGWTAHGLGRVDAIAVSRSELYVAAGDYPDATLSAFSLATGKLINRVSVPGLPVSLHAGPGGSVWLTFGVDQAGGRSGLWLLRADLSARSVLGTRTASGMDLWDVLPVGSVDAVAADHGLVDVHMPVPGRGGSPSVRPIAPLPTRPGFGRLVVVQSIVRLGRRFAVLESNSARYWMAIAGRPGAVWGWRTYGIDSVASSRHGLWMVFGTRGSPTGSVWYLNDQLRPMTPDSVIHSHALAYAEQVWTGGSTVVVSTDVAARPMACFSDRNGIGPIREIPARLPPLDVAVNGDAVYAADALGVIVYHMPAACR